MTNYLSSLPLSKKGINGFQLKDKHTANKIEIEIDNNQKEGVANLPLMEALIAF